MKLEIFGKILQKSSVRMHVLLTMWIKVMIWEGLLITLISITSIAIFLSRTKNGYPPDVFEIHGELYQTVSYLLAVSPSPFGDAN